MEKKIGDSDFPMMVYGSIDKNGRITSGSNFSCHRESNGTYRIVFSLPFSEAPAVVGSQTNFGSMGESTLDQITFPFVYKDSCTVLTGGSSGNAEDRSFSFIAVGPMGR